jgi:beta-lactamase regulating signal transducer with metallopeptidase domain
MKVTFLILIALSINAVLRKQSAALRHWVLAMGILSAGLTPLLGMVLPEWHLPMENRVMSGSSDQAIPPSATTDVEFSIQQKQDSVNASPRVSVDRLLRTVWLAGTALSLLILVVGLSRLAWLASRSRQVADPRWEKLLGPVSLLHSHHPTLLVTWGLMNPKIILPAPAPDWSEERLRIVLSHEMAHIRRGDWFVQMLAEVLRSVYWFNPVVWVACRRLRQESEQACDDAVLSGGVEGSEYATQLLGLARDLRQPRGTVFSGFPAPAMARPSSLGRRVHAMLNAGINRNPISTSARVATVIALLLIAVPIAMAQAFSSLSGTLIDATGGTLPDAKVTLSNTQRQSKYEVKSSQNGTFEFVGLPSGVYELDVQQLGFETFHESVSIAPGQNLQRRLTLHVGSLEETVTVSTSVDPAAAAAADARRQANITQRVPFQPADLSGCVATPVGGSIRAPKKLRDMVPEYPASLRGTGVDGVVVMDSTIGLDGFPKNIEVREGANPELANAAVTALREWQYSQTILNCTPIEVSMKVTMRFIHMP